MVVIKSLFCLLFLAFSVDRINADEHLPKRIFGVDDRFAMIDREMPWQMIGKLTSSQGHCSAALVGKDLILTNSHCLVDSNGVAKSQLEFHAQMISGVSFKSAYVTETFLGTSFYRNNPHLDYAFARIHRPLGLELGYFQISPQTDVFALDLTLAGYSGDFFQGRTAGVHQGCNFYGPLYLRSGEVLSHDCDMNSGASGGPIFIEKDNQFTIVGVNSAHLRGRPWLERFSHFYANIAIPSHRFYQSFHNAKKEKSNILRFYVCNDLKESQRFSLGFYKTDNSKLARGYFSMRPNTCRSFRFVDLKDYKELYIHLNNEVMNSKRKERNFCTKSRILSFGWYSRSSQKCSSRRNKSFVKMNTFIEARGSVFNLSEFVE